MPDHGPSKFKGADPNDRDTPSPSSTVMSWIDQEEERLKEAAEKYPPDPFAMSAYSRFLKNKRGDLERAKMWHDLAHATVTSRLSPNVTDMIRYHSK
ncbi:hypothetical protein GUITHDRAFT_120888 [Guillardia theta CCMP2712]|uniref:Uncharacterized protein n=1 Tax=Guillardia theta (strain CCMP2712) TaxID=905079 RepID=L1IA20_GUITC|nr:hypothetical protein GUITHDRAFT_120888 [Guillardia theta CCMP2712]EKX32937.1 hypothetical protein GUITHDRAFT_120888 [Guillardia theta CCMP2712]|eukprot:XP_005819917.1 hypothetical protein GUITHDRAFT_120888 [Guillardia theta CCMP2712]